MTGVKKEEIDSNDSDIKAALPTVDKEKLDSNDTDIKVAMSDVKKEEVDSNGTDIKVAVAEITKSNGDAVHTTEKEKKIIKQIEYYFSDINLSRDVFMKNLVAEDDGWISMDTMLKFNRLKAISDDIEEILAAMEKSSNDLIEISDNRKKIRRNPNEPLPESLKEATNQYLDRTIYVKGFASEDNLDDIQEFLEQAGPTINIHMRRLKDKKFKGSVFAIFKNKEDAEKFLTMEETKTYKEQLLVRSWQQEYFKRKAVERDASRLERQKRLQEAEDARETALLDLMTLGAILELSGFPKSEAEKKDDRDSYESGKAEREKVNKVKEWLMKQLDGVAEIAWVDLDPVEGKAFVRFHKENTAALALEKMEKPIQYDEMELTASVLTGDEEKLRWKVILAERKKKFKGSRGNSGRGGGGRGGGGRDRKFGRHRDEPKSKRIRLDD